MGKNPWEDPDHEVAALAATMRTKSPNRWLRIAVGLLVVAVLTFVAAYYVPLFRAHDALRDDFQQLSERRRVLDETLKNKERELEHTKEEKAALQAKIDQRAAAEQAVTERLEKLETSISSSLRAQQTRGLAASSVEDGQVRISLANNLVFSPHTLTIGSRGTSVLCDAVSEVKGGSIRVTSVTSPDEPPSVQLRSKYSTPRELSAARAAAVSNRIEQSCKVPAERLEAVALVQDGKGKISGVKLPAVLLELSPPEK